MALEIRQFEVMDLWLHFSRTTCVIYERYLVQSSKHTHLLGEKVVLFERSQPLLRGPRRLKSTLGAAKTMQIRYRAVLSVMLKLDASPITQRKT